MGFTVYVALALRSCYDICMGYTVGRCGEEFMELIRLQVSLMQSWGPLDSLGRTLVTLHKMSSTIS